ncbi:Hypothetical predicted protein [Mytilus galloprovincialis]|uniref:DDE-1 domain-containing protein n=1 Tax=Mytilus galloprovincialis TaxID=29158 RepID=A0A8B6FI71_MYTGA|nr:Hypothetical predicted protein [Mytilus galloprovincialis]
MLPAARKFSKDLQLDIKESAVRAMKKKYLVHSKESNHQPVNALTPEKRGRPLLLGDLDKDVAAHIRSIREAGGIVNQAIVIATARGLVKHKNPTLLSEADSGTSSERVPKQPENYQLTLSTKKSEFHRIINETVTKYQVPPQLIFNFDQTGLKIVPVSNWTLEMEGSKQVDIIGLEDKREITGLLGSTSDGCLLPPQILYQESHWSNEQSMVRYIETVLVPYTDKVKEELDLPIRQQSIAIFDVFRAHRCQEVLDALSKARIQHVFVPAGCTGELQPMDLSVNGELKAAMKNEFTNWYADMVAEDLKDSSTINKVDLRLSVLKPLHAKWLSKVFHDLKSKKDIILLGWKKSETVEIHNLSGESVWDLPSDIDDSSTSKSLPSSASKKVSSSSSTQSTRAPSPLRSQEKKDVQKKPGNTSSQKSSDSRSRGRGRGGVTPAARSPGDRRLSSHNRFSTLIIETEMETESVPPPERSRSQGERNKNAGKLGSIRPSFIK